MSEHGSGVRTDERPAAGGDGARVLDGRYRLGGLLGRGGMATVYRARDLLLERDVAVKLFPPAVEDGDDLLRHSSEIRILATLNHPGLVALYDAGTVHDDDGLQQLYLVMELVDGPDLADRLRHGPTSAGEATLIGQRVAAALELVHANGIIHRDIKPGNILLAAAGGSTDGSSGQSTVVKIADFGIARLTGATRLTMTGVTLGTVRYLSPEQVAGGPLEPSSDIYSLGLVLIECLSGRAVFEGTLAEVAVARLTSPPRLPPNLGSELADLLTRMTAFAPTDRPDAAQVSAALSELLASGADDTVAMPVAGPPDPTAISPADAAPAPGRRAQRWFAAGVLALVLVVAGIVAGLRHESPETPVAPPSYPAVQGDLGDALTSLQRSVVP